MYPRLISHRRRDEDDRATPRTARPNPAPGMPRYLGAAVQPHLRVNDPHDAAEAEADQLAEQMSSPCPACGAGATPCPKCAAKQVQRKPSASPAPKHSVSPRYLQNLGSGQPLAAATRSRFEAPLGVGLHGVRLHTGPEADHAAQSIGARAFTRGNDIAFAQDEYRPGSADGDRLLAHELVHVAQQNGPGGGIIQRDPRPEGATARTITPLWAQQLDDAALQEEIQAVRDALGTTDKASPEFESLRGNLDVLEAEAGVRALGPLPITGQSVGAVPRPPGLPMDGGFMLQPLDLPDDVAAGIPEGELIDLASVSAPPQGSGISGTTVTTPLAGSAAAGNLSLNAQLVKSGFAAAGENSVGLVGIPRWTPGNAFQGRVPFVPESMSTPGHTAMIVRLNGQMHVFGMAPKSSVATVMNYGALMAGETTTPGAITDDAWLFTKRTARSVEWAVDPQVAEQALANARGASPPNYSFVPNQQPNAMNCGLWACTQVQDAAGQSVTTKGGTPVTDVPAPRATGQGPLMRALKEGDIAPLAGESPVLGGMTKGMKVLKWGGRVFFVIGVATTTYDIATAKPEERARTAAREVTGFAAGFAAGAAAGLVCGPGALACSIVLGLGFGLAGTLIGREVGESVYDAATNNDYVDECDRPRPPCPNCHQRSCPSWSVAGGGSGFRMSSPLMKDLNDRDLTTLLEYMRERK